MPARSSLANAIDFDYAIQGWKSSLACFSNGRAIQDRLLAFSSGGKTYLSSCGPRLRAARFLSCFFFGCGATRIAAFLAAPIGPRL
eukprot:scaffold4686_cov230-Pinguiococcus_pyrenoidosus.AAC.7